MSLKFHRRVNYLKGVGATFKLVFMYQKNVAWSQTHFSILFIIFQAQEEKYNKELKEGKVGRHTEFNYACFLVQSR